MLAVAGGRDKGKKSAQKRTSPLLRNNQKRTEQRQLKNVVGIRTKKGNNLGWKNLTLRGLGVGTTCRKNFI